MVIDCLVKSSIVHIPEPYAPSTKSTNAVNGN